MSFEQEDEVVLEQVNTCLETLKVTPAKDTSKLTPNSIDKKVSKVSKSLKRKLELLSQTDSQESDSEVKFLIRHSQGRIISGQGEGVKIVRGGGVNIFTLIYRGNFSLGG